MLIKSKNTTIVKSKVSSIEIDEYDNSMIIRSGNDYSIISNDNQKVLQFWFNKIQNELFSLENTILEDEINE